MIKTYDEFVLENFNKDSDMWFDKMADNKKLWISHDMLKFTKMPATKATIKSLIEHVSKIKDDLPGKTDFLEFLKSINSGKYNKEFKNIEGKNSLIEETIQLLVQVLEY